MQESVTTLNTPAPVEPARAVAVQQLGGLYESIARKIGETFPFLVQHTLLNNTYAAWLVALGAVILIFFVLSLIRTALLARAKQYARKKHKPWIELAVRVVMKTSVLIIAAIALGAGLSGLDLPHGLSRAIDVVIIALVGVQAAIWATVVADWGLVLVLSLHGKASAEDAERTAKTSMVAVRFIVLVAVYAIIILIALDNFGINVSAMIAGLGVGGIAVALAAQKILGDVFSSLSITLDKPFEVGDFIIVGKEMGTVEVIGIKTTRVRALSGEQLVFSNGDLLAARIQNFKRMKERRCVFTFGVQYDTPLDAVRAIPGVVREIISSQKNARLDRAHFLTFGDSALNFEVVYYMTVPDYNAYADTQQAINIALAERLQAMGVEFAFPTRTVHLFRHDAPGEGAAPSNPRLG